jgi:predicted RNA-binding Zn ribbon-like protein
VFKSLALSLASTIRHDGNGGVADDLTELDGLTAWVRAEADCLGNWARAYAADEKTWSRVIEVRGAVRTLFAHAVNRTDQPRGPALKKLNSSASLVPVKLVLEWPDEAEPTVKAVAPDADPALVLPAILARAAIEFLGGPYRTELRACTAPRCVRYFVREHGRQEFCKPSCSNRARAARHYQKSQPGV